MTGDNIHKRISIFCYKSTNFVFIFIKVRKILAEYDPNFVPMGLDEAYLNITEYLEGKKNWHEGKNKKAFHKSVIIRLE